MQFLMMEARTGGERRLARYGIKGGVARAITRGAGGETIEAEEAREARRKALAERGRRRR